MRASSLRVAAVQTVSGSDVGANLAAIEPLVSDAAKQGARLVLLPEYFGIFGDSASDKVVVRESEGSGRQQDFLSRLARRHGIWLIGGTVPLAVADATRVRSASLAYAPDGRCVARYDKIHLFAFSRGEDRYDEARTIEAGSAPASFEAPCGKVGMSVCYDLRFPELYRSYRDVALLLVPSAFTAVTGEAHWHLLLRTRAVENQCYVLAAAQGGLHGNGRRTYGHSMLVDPWGIVMAELPDGPGVIVAEVDPERIAAVRSELPALAHRRL